jgi:DNA repair exonuclease SbcCD ATPase subunit
MSNHTSPSTNEQSDNGRDEPVDLGRDTTDMRLVSLERLVASIISSIDDIKLQDLPVDTKPPLASRDISRELENIRTSLTLATESSRQITNRIETVEQQLTDFREISDAARIDKNRINELEIRLNDFYGSLNYLNRFQSQLDGIVDRIDAIERSLENALNVNVNSKIEAISSSYSRLDERGNSIEARLSSVEHTVLNLVNPRRFVAAVKRKILRRFGKSV